MRAIVDLATNRIVRASATPHGEYTNMSGHYPFPVPEGAAVSINESSRILPQPAGLSGLSAQELLVRYPMYDFIHYNFLIEAADIAALDLTPGAPVPAVPGSAGPRCMVGRGSGAPSGNAPGCVTLLKQNSAAGGRKGLLVTDTIDISAVTSDPAGTDEGMVWYSVAQVLRQEDVSRGYGASTVNLGNQPGYRMLEHLPAASSAVDAYLSNDDGATWYQAGYLEPTDLVDLGSNLRVCFLNNHPRNEYVILGFCVLFVDTWVSG